VKKEVPPAGKRRVSHIMPFKLPKKKHSVLRVFAIFFHPSASVTAMGGAERRFVETLKIFQGKDDLEITVLESGPSLLTKQKINCGRYLLSSGFQGKGWLSTYLGWVLWIVRACMKSFSLVGHLKPNVVFVPNNTLPNLVSSYIVSFVFQKPLCIVVHHIDSPFCKGNLNDQSVYSCYRKIEYGKLVSLVKTLAFYSVLPIVKRAKSVITVSNFTGKALVDNGISASKLIVSGNAVDFNRIDAVQPRYHKKVFDGVFVGRIAKEKGVFDLIDLWKDIVKVRKEAKLLIVGTGLELRAIKEEIFASGLEDNVFVRGQCNDAELYSLLKASKIFIFPSLFEGWGIAVAEALACGLPILTYDIPALREVFGKCKSVFLVPVKDVESMASTVLRVFNGSSNKLAELSYCSKVYSKQFCWQKIAEKDLECLRAFEKS